MSTVMILACIWVLAATAVALLPMRYQYAPGLVLLIAAPVLIAMIWFSHGWLAGGAALAGFVSMFRNPLRYFWRKWRGLETEVPK